MITTVVTAFPVCMCTIFPCFSKEKKNNNNARKEKRRDRETEKKEISYFSAKKKSPSKTKKLRVECKTNMPDPVDQNELHRLKFTPFSYLCPFSVL